MKITKKHKLRSAWGIGYGTFIIIASLKYYRQDSLLLCCLFIIGGIFLIYEAYKNYIEVWEVTKDGSAYRIHKNRKLAFDGNVEDLLAVSDDSKDFLIYPRKGKCITFPKSTEKNLVTDLYREYRANNVVEQVEASDRAPRLSR